MIKKTLLYFLCLFLLLSVFSCKKKTPTQPIIPELILPTIVYFTASPASIMFGDSSMLSWSTTNATNITINQGIGTVDATGTINVSGFEETRTYTLTAINADGQRTASCMVEVVKWAELEVALNPELPIFLYDPVYNLCVTEFTVMMTESAGVGGVIDGLLVEAWTDVLLHSEIFPGGTFGPFGSLSCYCPLVIVGQPNGIVIWIEGMDLNGYMIELYYYFYVYWTQERGTMSLDRIVKGANHHKKIR